MTPWMLIKDDIPPQLIGIQLYNRFGSGFSFGFDEAKTVDLYFQSSNFMQIIRHLSNNVIHEYKGMSHFLCPLRINDPLFFQSILGFHLAAIDEFNRNLKRKPSTLTRFETYSPVPKIEHIIAPVRQAYMMLDFNNTPSSN